MKTQQNQLVERFLRGLSVGFDFPAGTLGDLGLLEFALGNACV
jgi:hypothetical protein